VLGLEIGEVGHAADGERARVLLEHVQNGEELGEVVAHEEALQFFFGRGSLVALGHLADHEHVLFVARILLVVEHGRAEVVQQIVARLVDTLGGHEGRGGLDVVELHAGFAAVDWQVQMVRHSRGAPDVGATILSTANILHRVAKGLLSKRFIWLLPRGVVTLSLAAVCRQSVLASFVNLAGFLRLVQLRLCVAQ